MHDLKWSDYQVIECLGVLPTVDEYKVDYSFKKESGGLTLELSVWPLESLVALSLFRNGYEHQFYSIWFVVRDRVRYINDKRGSYLNFEDIVIVKPTRGYYLDQGDVFDRAFWRGMINLVLSPEPIRISFE